MINFTPEGLAADFFTVFAPYVPAGPSPTLWGSEPYVRQRFDGCELDLVRRDYVERVAGGPQGFVDFYRETFGPAAAISDPHFARDLLAFAERADEGEGDAELRFEYLRLLAHLPPA
jgi:hypothetical protein